MRTLIYPLLLGSLSAAASGPDNFHVVVRTTDRMVVNYVCGEATGAGQTGIIVRTEVKAKGNFNWHVVGGVAPYTVLRNEAGAGGGCITVMDAEGHTATGCGTINTVSENLSVDCRWYKPDTTSQGIAPNKYTDAQRSNPHPERPVVLPPPVTGPTTGTPSPTPADPPHAKPGDSYRPPVKTPSPDEPDPPHVKPGDVVREPSRDPRDGSGAPPPLPKPRIIPRGGSNPGTPSPAPSRSGGGWSPSNGASPSHSPSPGPRPVPPPATATPVKSTW